MEQDLRDKRIETLRKTREKCDSLGIKRGRKIGSICPKKLDGRENEIMDLLLDNRSIQYIARQLNVSNLTLSRHLERMGLNEYRQRGKRAKSFEIMDENIDFIKENFGVMGIYSMSWKLGVSPYFYKLYCKERGIR